MNNNFPFFCKFTPYQLTDMHLDPYIFEITKSMISMNNLNILFLGGGGVGKTTIINCIIAEYSKNHNLSLSDDVLYINTIKDQGISFYRNDVKTFCQCSSTSPVKRIVVLDDFDLINDQSQQVFQNYMDKYGEHVHFLSSCSNTQKVTEGVQSRSVVIKLNKPTNAQLLSLCNHIIKTQEMTVTTEAKLALVKMSNNMFSILVNQLEKLYLLKEDIDVNLILENRTEISFCEFDKYIDMCINNRLYLAVRFMLSLHNKGFSVIDILCNFYVYVMHTTKCSDTHKYTIIKLLCKYICIFQNLHEENIELALFTKELVLMFSASILNECTNIQE